MLELASLIAAAAAGSALTTMFVSTWRRDPDRPPVSVAGPEPPCGGCRVAADSGTSPRIISGDERPERGLHGGPGARQSVASQGLQPVKDRSRARDSQRARLFEVVRAWSARMFRLLCRDWQLVARCFVEVMRRRPSQSRQWPFLRLVVDVVEVVLQDTPGKGTEWRPPWWCASGPVSSAGVAWRRRAATA